MPKVLWSNVLNSLESKINKQSFNMWLKDTEPLSITGNIIKIRVMDDVARRHISDQYSGQINSVLKNLTGLNYECEFIASNGFSPDKKASDEPNGNIKTNSESLRNGFKNMESLLNPNYIFSNFVVGPNNQLAHAAAHSVSRSPGTQINPLFIYGGAGLGKTHLMQAIGHYVISEKPYLKVLYVPSEQFINEFISSIRTNTTDSFKIKYRDVDILLIDDIQFIEKKEETQNEFFHTFNTLYDNKKQIVISSDRPPKELSTLAERLKTRFEWGMITDIQPPNLETREAILRNKAEKLNLQLPDDVFYYIAKRIKSNIRALEASLTRLNMVASLYNEPISINHAKNHLKDLFNDDTNKKVTIGDIMVKVADKNGVSIEELVSKSRHSRIIQPRFIAMYLARQLTGMTTIDIGKEFGDRDHSTVLNAISKIEEDMKKDPDLSEIIEDFIVELKS
ncbi:MAG: chromosomal replication initiator protein DnaA [Spirochaetes bacterium]|nr:chromosomal replication initiator protein DnaA [Spirochaetota bacterium]